MSLGSFQSRIRLDWLEESALHVFMVLLKNSPSTLKTTDFSLYRKKTNLNLFILDLELHQIVLQNYFEAFFPISFLCKHSGATELLLTFYLANSFF